MKQKKFNPVVIHCKSCNSPGPFRKRFKVPDEYYRHDTLLQVVTCNVCGMCFLNPQYSQEAYEDFYSNEYYLNSQEDIDANRVYLSEYYATIHPVMEKFLKTFKQDGRYLEAGVGSGVWFDFLRKYDADFEKREIHALEPSFSCATYLSKRFPTVNVHRQIIESNDFSAGFFHNVFCSALIEHFCDPLFSLLHFNQMMAMHGHIMFLTPAFDEQCLHAGATRFFKFTHTFYFTKKSLQAILKKAGFEVQWWDYRAGSEVRNVKTSPLYVVCARKVEDKFASEMNAYRQAIPLDRENMAETEKLFAHLGKDLKKFVRNFIVRRTVKKLIPNQLRPIVKAIFDRL